MRKNVKRIISLALAALMIMIMCTCALASTSRVFDNAELFTSSEESALQSKLDSAIKSTGVDFAILTTDYTQGMSTRGYSSTFYENNGLGLGSDKSGVMFVLDFYNGQAYVLTSGKMIDYITDDRREAMLDNAFYYRGDDDYYSMMTSLISDAAKYVQLGIPDDIEYYDEDTGEITPRQPQGFTPMLFLVSFVIAAVIGAIVCFISKSKYQLKNQVYNYDFHEFSNMRLIDRSDVLVDKKHTSVRAPSAPPPTRGGGRGPGARPSGGGGVRSTTFRTPSGGSFGGGGRRL